MKRQIRRFTFETNSSSMHSLVITKNNERFTPDEILKDIYLFDDYEASEYSCIWQISDYHLDFGRSPFRPIFTFAEKWCYACASLVNQYNDSTYKELVSIAMKYVPGLKKIELSKRIKTIPIKKANSTLSSESAMNGYEFMNYIDGLEDLYGEEINCWKNDKDDWMYESYYTGSIDTYVLGSFLKRYNISLEEFLINKKYVVIQDGDEYYYWDEMKQTGLVNLGMIEEEYK